jgi:hypothetical protein
MNPHRKGHLRLKNLFLNMTQFAVRTATWVTPVLRAALQSFSELARGLGLLPSPQSPIYEDFLIWKTINRAEKVAIRRLPGIPLQLDQLPH